MKTNTEGKPKPESEAKAKPKPKAKAKVVAKSLSEIHKDSRMRNILDLSQDVSATTWDLLNQWSCDLYTRKPGPAVTDDGRFKGTDLDLATFLMALADRKAVINLPTYKSKRGQKSKKGERVTSKDNRHGNIIGLTANKDVFSFSIRINDANVITSDPETGEETVGAPRNFMLVDVDGEWHSGWRRIEFSPTAKENDFLNDKNLWTGNSIIFKNFVSPGRWQSFYGHYYFLTKVLIERLAEEARFLKSLIDLWKEKGTKYPDEKPGTVRSPGEISTKDDTKPVKVKALEVIAHIGDFKKQFKTPRRSAKKLEEITQRRLDLIYSIIPRLRFATRSVELAFFKNMQSNGEVPRIAHWIENAAWEKDFSLPKKRTKYFRLVLGQHAVGKLGTSLLFRVRQKTERIAR